MKHFILSAMIALFVGCRKEVSGWERLTPTQQNEVRNRATLQCSSGADVSYNSFKGSSDNQYNPGNSTTFVRNQTWKIESKKDTVELSTSYIAVWKVATNTVYLIWVNNTAEGFTNYKFIKIDSATNSEMIEDLKFKKCNNKTSLTITESGDTVVLKPVVSTTTLDTSTRLQVEKTYTFRFSELAFFGIFHEKRVHRKIKNDNTVASTENYSLELSVVTDPAALPDTYTNYDSSKTSFCVVKEVATNSYPFHYGDNLNCSPTPTEFDPTTEL